MEALAWCIHIHGFFVVVCFSHYLSYLGQIRTYTHTKKNADT